MTKEEITASRLNVCRIAQTYLRTPYHDNAAVKGHGADCATLLLMVYTEAGLIGGVDLPEYSAQWYLHQSDELYLNRIKEYADEIMQGDVQPGDLVMCRFGRCFSHSGIFLDSGYPNIIHAQKQARMVTLGDCTQGDMGPRRRLYFSPRVWRE